MTAIADAQTVIDTLLGRSSTVGEQTRVATAFVTADPYFLLESIAVDQQAPTNEEKALLFLETVRKYAVDLVRDVAMRSARAANDATVDAAADTAEADLTP